MMGKATTCLYWNIGGGRCAGRLAGYHDNRCVKGSLLPEDEKAVGVEVGAEAVVRQGGTLKLIPGSKKGCDEAEGESGYEIGKRKWKTRRRLRGLASEKEEEEMRMHS